MNIDRSLAAGKTRNRMWSHASIRLQRSCDCGQHTAAGAECEGCKKQKATLRRTSDGPGAPMFAPHIVHDVLRSPGQPLDSATRTFVERRLGRDFSAVRVHTDSKAAESAQSISAQAYTFGKDVVFDSGKYEPATESGRRLLTHELAHVVQQQNTPRTNGTLRIGDPHETSEGEADRAARQTTPLSFAMSSTPATIARKEKDQVKSKGKDAAGEKEKTEKDKSEKEKSEKAAPCIQPTKVTLGRTEVLDLSSYMTGGGICAVMKVAPAEANLCSGITEEVTQGDGATCPGSLLKPSLCSGNSTFPLGKAPHGACTSVKPEATEFVDRHSTQLAGISVLHDETRNPRKLDRCAFTCKQRYFIASGSTSTTLGKFLISYSLAKTKRDGKDATNVTVSKKAAT